jgi:phage virion morphogenesis protein
MHGNDKAISLGFTGRVARIARVHQYGLRDRPEPNARDARYEMRELLGFTGADLDTIREGLFNYLRGT